MSNQCKFCGEVKELRFGGCWSCADAESVIEEGLDMYDKGIDGVFNFPAGTGGQKLKILIDKGWVRLSNLEKQKLKAPEKKWWQLIFK